MTFNDNLKAIEQEPEKKGTTNSKRMLIYLKQVIGNLT